MTQLRREGRKRYGVREEEGKGVVADAIMRWREVLTCCYNCEEELDEVEEVEEYDKSEGAEEGEEEDVPAIQVVHSWGGGGGGGKAK